MEQNIQDYQSQTLVVHKVIVPDVKDLLRLGVLAAMMYGAVTGGGQITLNMKVNVDSGKVESGLKSASIPLHKHSGRFALKNSCISGTNK